MTSSTRPSAEPASGPTRPDRTIRFSLTGPSRSFDPARQAIRADLADVAEAEHHFAPHYAAPLPCLAVRQTGLFETPASTAPATMLPEKTAFDVLDVTGNWAWGYVTGSHAVGYVAAADLEQDLGDGA